MIKVIGLGNRIGDLTLLAVEAINNAEIVVVKTALIDTYSYFTNNDIETITFDYLYTNSETFEDLNLAILNEIIMLGDKEIVYCVAGSGSDDSSVISMSKELDIEIISGISLEESVLSKYPTYGYTTVFASDYVKARNSYADTNLTYIIKELDNQYLASDVKLKMLGLYGEIKVIYSINNKTVKIDLAELDRQNEYNSTSICMIEPLGNYNKQRYNFLDLMEIVYRLRDPDGCKWDRQQTHESIRSNAIEEAYELVEAVNNKDIENMIEESGDVLLQGVFHAVIAESTGDFDITDVMTTLCTKLITRHTHVFGETTATNEIEALKAWETAKAIEKGQQTYISRMESVAKNLPALTRAYKIQKIAKKAGFDWADVQGAIDKINEESLELLEAKPTEQEMEAGDLLFAVVNVLRFMNIEPEVALLRTIDKFETRFKYVEEKATENGRDIRDCSLDELETYWEQAKHADR